MNKLYKDIPRMIRSLKIIEQYNNYKQLGAIEDINYLIERVNSLIYIKNSVELIEEFTWCVKMINMYLEEIDPEFKRHFYKEEQRKELEEFG